MPEKNFLNMHVLMSHSPSCLNRDDMNMQKSAVFGGARRVRISSQSLKRAFRESDYYAESLGYPSDRTRQLEKLAGKLTRQLADKFPKEIVESAIKLIAGVDEITNDAKIAVAPWVSAEVEKYCDELQAGKDVKTIEKEMKVNLKGFRQALGEGVDVALSGRMATSGLMSKVDGSLAVAHALTTHAVDADIDWFTAVDDLVSDEGEVGAGHLNTQEFSSGVFYRFASLNLGQLQANLGGVERKKVLEIARHALHMLATVIPSGKQNSFAAFNLADCVMAAFSDQPISLANAFESPVKAEGDGLLRPSLERLSDYWQKVYQGYGLDDRAAAFSLEKSNFSPCFGKLPELETWVESDGR